jgi:hypothetical protein
LAVNHGVATSIYIAPYNASVAAGTNETYTVTAFDGSGNSWDVTNIVSWGIDANAYGSWSDNVYTSAKAGVWNVTASMFDFSNTLLLNVTHGSAASIALTPQSSVVLAGQSQTFVASASDLYGNSWDVTGSASWSVDSGAGGSWSSSTYTSSNSGNWTVTATYSDMQSEAVLTVNTPASSPASPLPVATAAPLVATASPPATATPSPSQSPSPTETAKPTADPKQTIRPTSIGNSVTASPGTTVLSLLVLVIAIFSVITVAIIDVQERKKSK